MNEKVARETLLVQAIEGADRQGQVLSEDDKKYASSSALELAQWQAAERRTSLTPELFLEKRSQQILKKIVERTPSFAAAIQDRKLLKWMGVALPFAALLLGACADRIGDPHRVDLLSAPLILIVAWNLLVYLGLLTGWFLPKIGRRKPAFAYVQRLGAGKANLPRKLPQALTIALISFVAEWTVISAPLTAARIKRIVHCSAALFALGAVLSLYARGILSEYRAGWESTFLGAEQVHAILTVLFWPAVALFHLHSFSAADIAALRFAEAASPAGGAIWVHLYGATLLLLVIVPRLALAAFAGWQAGKISRNFPIDLNQAYFLKLGAGTGNTAAVLRVFPYSFTLSEQRDKGLHAVAKMLLGESARVMLRPSIAYGEEPQDALQATNLGDPEITLSVALFNLSATPEKENHGAFLDYLSRGSANAVSVLIDESGYAERAGQLAGGAARLSERIAMWRQFCELHDVDVNIVNLLDPGTSRSKQEHGPSPLAGTS
ncbi:DUF2868 domain-containing protein [Undibacterium sp.]|uniref:DUF2868 domain-containing protein n=1 Tax=Undibacterium sp. TaxID=1914977 RepID=UPI002B97D6FC|nr:DUF2868 domain-containing protein [Undibacterium sp.]HTD04421.1 DUF2868 domain-containing protein [Undibacterium sp.]